MMGAFASLFIRLRGDTEPFRKDMRKMEADVRRSTQGVTKAFSRMGAGMDSSIRKITSLRSLAIATAATGFAYMAKRAIDSADAIAKLSDRIGVSTDALQELRHVADLAGVSQQALDTSLERFVKRIGEAARGTGEAKKVYEQLGIRILDASGNLRDQNDILSDVADAMAGMKTQTEKVAAAAALFGREGTSMVNVLEDGGDALNKARKAARDYGVVIDEELIRKSEKVKDALSILGKQFKTEFTEAVLEGAEEIREVVELLISSFEFWNKLINKPAKVRAVDLQVKNIKETEREIENLERRLAVFQTTGQPTKGIEDALRTKRKLLENLTEQLRMLNENRKKEHEAAKEEVKNLDDATQAWIDYVNALQTAAHVPAELFPVIEIERSTTGLEELQRQLQETSDTGVRSIDEIVQENQDYLNVMDALRIKYDEFEANADEKLKKVREYWQESNEDIKRLMRELEAAGQRMAYSFEDAIVRATQTGKFEWREMISDMLAQLQRLIIRQTITEPLTRWFTKGLGLVFGGGSSFSSVGSPGATGVLKLGDASPIRHKPMVKGEKGVVVNQVLNIYPGVPEAARQEIQKARPMLMRDAIKAVSMAKARGLKNLR